MFSDCWAALRLSDPAVKLRTPAVVFGRFSFVLSRFFRIDEQRTSGGSRQLEAQAQGHRLQPRAAAITKFNMGKFGGYALNLGQQIRIKHELQNMFGMGIAAPCPSAG